VVVHHRDTAHILSVIEPSSFDSSDVRDSTISVDCMIGYDSPVQISTVRNDERQTSALKQVAIFCDGSSLGNGKEASRAAAVALLGYKGYWRAVGEYLGKATNQQAEIVAAAVGLESLKQPCQVSVFTDSKYVVETMNGRFRKKANLPWWERLDRAAKAHKVHWEWTRGHAGHILQEAADNAARRIAAAGQVDKSILEDAELKVGTIEPADLRG
jgi:ribonuclease HI